MASVMSVVDTLVLGVLAIGLILGMVRGFVSQVTGLLGLVGGLFVAMRYNAPLRKAVLDPNFTWDHNGEVAFLSILIVCVFFVAAVGWAVRKVVDKLELGAYDRIMGAGFGIVKAGLITGGVMLGIVSFAPDEGGIEKAIGRSKAGPRLWSFMETVADVLPTKVRGDVQEFLLDNALPAKSAKETARGEAGERRRNDPSQKHPLAAPEPPE